MGSFFAVLKRTINNATLLLLLAALPAIVCSQTAAQQFASADWFTRPLASGITWKYYLFENLFGARQSIQYIEADLNVSGVKVDIPYLAGLQRTSSMIKNQFPAAAGGINGTFFVSGGHQTYLRVDGTEVPPAGEWGSSWGYNGGFVFNRDTRVFNILKIPAAGWASTASTYTDAVVNGPILLKSGLITSSSFPSSSHCNRNPRTMVGLKPGNKLILMVVDGRDANAAGLTCQEMAEVMQALGCTDALSLDGGGSSAMYARGEPNNGVVSYPSDNDVYDHLGERAVANGIAVSGNAATPLPWDGRIESVSYTSAMQSGDRRTITVRYRNIGTQSWTGSRVAITTSRPKGRASQFYDPPTWTNNSTVLSIPAGIIVAPNSSLSLSFVLKGPVVPATQTIEETFQLTLDGATRFGPADSELRPKVTVSPRTGIDDWDLY